VEDFQNILEEEHSGFDKVWPESVSCSQGDEGHSEFPAKRQRISVISNDRSIYYRQLYCEIIDSMKAQLANRLSKLL
jgi:hypothetical protein